MTAVAMGAPSAIASDRATAPSTRRVTVLARGRDRGRRARPWSRRSKVAAGGSGGGVGGGHGAALGSRGEVADAVTLAVIAANAVSTALALLVLRVPATRPCFRRPVGPATRETQSLGSCGVTEIRGDGAQGRRGSLRAIALSAYGPTLLGSTGAGAVSPIIAVSARELGASVGVAALLVAMMGVGPAARRPAVGRARRAHR